MEIKYFVRTTGERKLDESFNQIDYELLIDTEHKPITSFIAQLKYISEYNAVLLEDDVILCKDFKKRIEEVINKYPDDIINFFTDPMRYFTTQYSLTFCYNQCTFYPMGLADQIAEAMIADFKIHSDAKGYDSIEARALMTLRIPHLQYRPCLVQHNDKKSLISFSNETRITPYFIDYLDALNLKYESKETVLHRQRLLYERNRHLNIDLLNKKSSK